MLRRTLFNNLTAISVIRWLPFRKTAPLASRDARPRFQFSPSGELMRSVDGGQTWAEALTLEPGYKTLRLWQQGAETHLQLDYTDHSVEMLSTDGTHWQTL